MPDPRVAAAISALARGLPADQIEDAARFVECHSADAAGALVARVPTARFASLARMLAEAWSEHPEISGEAVALALRAASVAAAQERATQHIEIVWTGPPAAGIPVRYTHGVLAELIHAAIEELTIVSFAAYKLETVTHAIRDAAGRGVHVRLVLDGGTDAHRAFTTLGDTVEVFTWPPTLLPEHDDGHASLHAKAAVADRRTAFVTSANLTGHAFDRNMELGLLVTGGPVPQRLSDHFDGLIAAGELTVWKT